MSRDRPFQVALLTGPSDRRGWALSPIQDTFLHSLGVPHDALVLTNFPYEPDPPPYRPVPLFMASINNGATYWASRWRGFGKAHQEPIERFLARADRTIFVAGSCGLELLNNLALARCSFERVSVFAYGPVARRRPDCRHLLVSGRQDWLSRLFFSAPDHTVECTHLSYLSDRPLRELCASFIAEVSGSTSLVRVAS